MYLRSLLIKTGSLFLSASIVANAQQLDANSDTQIVRVGQTFNVDLVLSGLTTNSAPSLGAFDFDILFDPSRLSVLLTDIGPSLSADLTNSIFIIDTETGVINIIEVSLEAPGILDASQAGTLAIGELTFQATQTGLVTVIPGNGIFADALGDPLRFSLNGTQVLIVDREQTEEFAQLFPGSTLSLISFSNTLQQCRTDEVKKNCVFAQYDNVNFEYDNLSETDTFSERSNRILLGFERSLTPWLSAGIAYSFEGFEGELGASTLDGDSRQSVGGSLKSSFGSLSIDGTISYSQSNGTIQTPFPEISGVGTSEQSLELMSYTLGAAYTFGSGPVEITPGFQVRYVDFDLEGFTETGAEVLNVQSAGLEESVIFFEPSISTKYTIPSSGSLGATVLLEARGHIADNSSGRLDITYTDLPLSGPPAFENSVDLAPNDFYSISGGLQIQLTNNASAEFGYTRSFGSGLRGQNLTASLSFIF